MHIFLLLGAPTSPQIDVPVRWPRTCVRKEAGQMECLPQRGRAAERWGGWVCAAFPTSLVCARLSASEYGHFPVCGVCEVREKWCTTETRGWLQVSTNAPTVVRPCTRTQQCQGTHTHTWTHTNTPTHTCGRASTLQSWFCSRSRRRWRSRSVGLTS